MREGVRGLALFEFYELRSVSRRKDSWGRSLRLLYGGGRSALYGVAPVGRSMGCAFALSTLNSQLVEYILSLRHW